MWKDRKTKREALWLTALMISITLGGGTGTVLQNQFDGGWTLGIAIAYLFILLADIRYELTFQNDKMRDSEDKLQAILDKVED